MVHVALIKQRGGMSARGDAEMKTPFLAAEGVRDLIERRAARDRLASCGTCQITEPLPSGNK
jgi:hypothetical protein